jgi:hypothetical protein
MLTLGALIGRIYGQIIQDMMTEQVSTTIITLLTHY